MLLFTEIRIRREVMVEIDDEGNEREIDEEKEKAQEKAVMLANT